MTMLMKAREELVPGEKGMYAPISCWIGNFPPTKLWVGNLMYLLISGGGGSWFVRRQRLHGWMEYKGNERNF